jgi:hypothetical protein
MRCAAIFFVAMLVAPLARAQSNDEAIAKLKAVGDERMHDLHFREALEQYDAAMKLGGGAAIQYNRARALQGLGDYPRALDALEEFVRTASPELRARVPQLDELIADLRGHVATLLIVSNVDHATIRVGHDVVGTTPINVPVRVSIGHVVLEASAPGFRTTTREMTLASGETHVDLALDKVEEPKAVPNTTIVPVKEHTSVMRPTAIALGAVGLGGLALGAIFGGVAVSKRSDLDALCPNKACDATGQSARNDAWTFATVSTIGLVSGAVLFAGGAVMFLLAPRASKHIAVSPFGVGGVF